MFKKRFLILQLTFLFAVIFYIPKNLHAETDDVPVAHNLDSELSNSIEYSDNVPYYLRDMLPNLVFLLENYPSIREFDKLFIKNEEKELFKRKFLTGDWGGLRTRIKNLGIVPTMTYVADFQGNPAGGDKKGFAYFHNIGLDLLIHTEQLMGWKGGRIHISASQRSGRSLTRRDIGNTFDVAQLCCGRTFKLVDLSIQQSLFEDKLNIRLGRIAGGDEFLSSPLYWLFVQNGIDGNPVGIFFNVGFSAYPNATWGIRVKSRPTKQSYIMAGVYNANPDRTKNKHHGADFSFDDPYLLIAETGYHLNALLESRGLPGSYKIGAYYQTGDFNDFTKSGATKNGNFGFYILLDQMIYHESGTRNQGLTPFVSLLFAPDSDINTFPFFMNGGLVYKGLIPGREQDYAGFGLVYGKYSSKLSPTPRQPTEFIIQSEITGSEDFEMVLEWMYKIQLTEWLNIQPDVQYVIKPGGTGDIPNALVIGFQMGINI
ncbi:MAG: porin [Thermodesulfobacteriota bacterium]|nr:MAG: porin [Thermodesulfobacteriota bacterium]